MKWNRFLPSPNVWDEIVLRSKSSSTNQIVVAGFFSLLNISNLSSSWSSAWLIQLFLLLIATTSYFRHRFAQQEKELNLTNFITFHFLLGIQAIAWSSSIALQISPTFGSDSSRLIGYMILAGVMTGGVQSLGPSNFSFSLFQSILLAPVGFNFLFQLLNGNFIKEPILVSLFFFFLQSQRKTQTQQWLLLQDSEKDLQSIINNFPGAISLVRDGRYIRANNQVSILSGLSLSQILGKNVGESNPDSEIPKLIREMSEHPDQNTLIREVPFKSRNQIKEHLVFLNRVSSRDMVVVSIDVSEQRAIERELDLQRAKAQNASKMAALGEMSSGLAHEINNPLAIISARIQRIRQLLSKPETKNNDLLPILDSIHATTHRIATIVKGLREFARDGSQDPFIPVSLNKVVLDTLSFCETRFKNHDVELKVGAIPDIEIECREVQLSQVLLNLLNNAHDAVEKLDRPWVDLSFHETADRIQIWVVDSGPGIPPEIREKLMQPFFTTKDVGKGTGLGLSLSKGLIEEHDGQLYFDFSSQNTKVVIDIPKKQAAVLPTAA